MILKTVYGSTAGGADWTFFLLIVTVAIVAGLIIVLRDNIGTSNQISILKPTPEDFQQFITALSVLATNNGYIPQSQTSGHYVFVKHQKPSALVGLLLLLLCLIPGILYLALGSSEQVVSIAVTDNGETFQFSSQAPGKVNRQITKMLAPYQVV